MKKYGKIYNVTRGFNNNASDMTLADHYGSNVLIGLATVRNKSMLCVNVTQNGMKMPSIVLHKKSDFEAFADSDCYKIMAICRKSITEKGCVDYKHIKWVLKNQ